MDLGCAECIPYRKVYRRTRADDWITCAKKCNKWTQTSNTCEVAMVKSKECSVRLLLQTEINRVIDLYNLSGSRDMNIHKAIADVIDRHICFQNDNEVSKLLRRRIGKTITYRKYYKKRRNKRKVNSK